MGDRDRERRTGIISALYISHSSPQEGKRKSTKKYAQKKPLFLITFLTLNAVERLAALKAAPRAIASSPRINI